jgi:hypothetical protein
MSLDLKHTEEALLKMSEIKKGSNNPMYNKPKSEAFIAEQYRDKAGFNNPMFGKVKSEETLAKLRPCFASQMIYVYDVTQNYKLLGVYSTVMCSLFKLSINTLKKE